MALGGVLCLGGCKEEAPKAPAQRVPQQIDQDFYKIKELPPVVQEEIPEPEPRIEEPVVPEVKFPDMRPLLREKKARQLRGRRSYLSRKQSLALKPLPQEAEEWVVSEEDYQQGETPFEQDLSTLPVDRRRILTADMRIPAILEDSVNTQTPGRLIAVVDKDVLSPTGKTILLPAYSKIICSYEGLSDASSSRLPVQCKRIIRPDGVSIPLTEATSADQMGRSGLIGDLDRRTIERYGAAFAVSVISALAQVSSSLTKQEAYANATNHLSNNLGQVTQKVLEKNIDLTPILTIPQGTRIQIIPFNDIFFKKPYKKKVSHDKK